MSVSPTKGFALRFIGLLLRVGCMIDRVRPPNPNELAILLKKGRLARHEALF